MTTPVAAADLRRILVRAENNDLWQEEDGSTREYDHEYFGFSDYIREVTAEAEHAAKLGLIELRGTSGLWAPTEAGEQWLTENGRND